jgi:dienelactone hydrolase
MNSQRNLRWTRVIAAFCVLAVASSAAIADEPKEKSSGSQLAAYFRAETEKLRDGCLAEIKTLDDWNAKKGEYRRQLFEMLSLDPLPEKTDLKATVTGRVEREDFVVEKLHFQSRPGLYVTANLYLPKAVDKPCPTILYLCGHGKVAKDGVSYGNKVHYQHHGIWFARHGYVCLVLDTLQLGEIEATHHGTYKFDRWWWNARGYTPAGVEAWNSIRALDYLATRKEVDAERIGATGRSGGGAYTWFVAALDDRVKAAVPVAGITDLENHVIDGVVEGHCDCMYFVNTYRWDYPQMAALVAPRPLLISNTDKDRIFPLEGVLRTHRVVRRIYALHDAEKNLGLHITEGPHEDTQELYMHAFVWFDKFLGGGRRPIDGPAVKLFEPEELKVFDKLPADEINTKIDETFVAKAAEPKVPASKEEWEKMRDGWMRDLREKVFRGWPEKAPALDVKELSGRALSGFHFGARAFEFLSEPNVRLRFEILNPGKVEHDYVLLFAADLEQYQPAELELMRVSRRATIVFFYPRGQGLGIRRTKSAEETHERRRFMLLGETLGGQQVWDIRRALQALRETEEFRNSKMIVAGRRHMAEAALYASLFEPNIERLEFPDFKHAQFPDCDLLNVRRSHDLSAAVAMAMERCPVQLEGADPDSYEFARLTGEALRWRTMSSEGKTTSRLEMKYVEPKVEPR